MDDFNRQMTKDWKELYFLQKELTQEYKQLYLDTMIEYEELKKRLHENNTD